MKILVVDDSRDNANSLARILSAHGHEATAAYDGTMGLVEMARLRPGVVVLDFLMPDMNGWQFVDEKALMADVSSIPVVVLSGYTDTVGREPFPPGQVVAVVDKAAPVSELLATLERVGTGKR